MPPSQSEARIHVGEHWRLGYGRDTTVVVVRGVGEVRRPRPGGRGGALWLEEVEGDTAGLHPNHSLHERDLLDSPNAERLS